MYFSYGKDKMPLQEVSRHSQDINLHIQTKNYNDGEEVEIMIKTTDNQSLAINAIIQNNEAVVMNILKESEESV